MRLSLVPAFLALAFLAVTTVEAHGPHGEPHTHSTGERWDTKPNDDLTVGDREPQWFKGNLHTHSLWSDGDDFPEMISDWYRVRDYDFLAISDHNVMHSGQRWMKVADIVKRGGETVIPKYIARFGQEWVETRGEPGSADAEIRLKPMDEYRYLLERSERFILIPGEEISDKVAGKPLHMNATNLAETLRPVGGATMREAIENNLRAVLEQEKKLGRELLIHLNHPNFHYAVTVEDIATAVSERFFEVYNGHPGVNHLGDDDHPSIERMWDLINHIRVNKLRSNVILGLGTDDSHHYHGKGGSRPGRGWVMVRSRYLTPEHLIRAIKAADFYASSGVTLKDVQWDPSTNTLSIEILPTENVQYKTEFIVTNQGADVEDVGRVAFTSTDLQCRYQLQDGEAIVRAMISSSQVPDDPVFDGQKQQAWSQPFVHSAILPTLTN